MQERHDAVLRVVEQRMRDYYQGVKDQKGYMWDHRREMDAIVERIRAFRDSDHHSLSVICKTRRQAVRVHKTLAKNSMTFTCSISAVRRWPMA